MNERILDLQEELESTRAELEQQKRYNAEYEEMITEAMEYINGYKVAGEVDITCFNKTTGRNENVGKDLQKILGGVKGINKILEVNNDIKIVDDAYTTVKEKWDDPMTIESLVQLIELQTCEIERLKDEILDYTKEYDYAGAYADEYYERTKLES